VLFDIDGTLVSAGPPSLRAFRAALLEVFGVAGPMDAFDYSGKTDPQIVRELMEAAGIAVERMTSERPRALSLYTEGLGRGLRAGDVRMKPGVPALLEALAGRPEVQLGLLTGNLEPCARLKLSPVDLNRFFPLGAYGSDDEDRYRLPPIAVARAFDHTGRRFVGTDVVIVGDSVHDVLCGRSLGVRAVAVATGRAGADTLAGAGAAAVLPDFADTEAALRAVLD
jgi:phosphoglycolate phosphatase-like HAD superfamily hydrolase